MKSIVAGLACFLISVIGCGASAPPPVSPDLSVARGDPSASAAPPPPQAPAASAAPSVPCAQDVSDYCPEQGAPDTCTDLDGTEKHIVRCSGHGGHCVARNCVEGPAACDALNEGETRTGVACNVRGLHCTWMSMMGNAWCSCEDGKWNCGHAGI